MAQKTDPQRLAEAVRIVVDGKGAPTASRLTGVSTSVIYRELKRIGFEPSKRRNPKFALSVERIEQAVERYEGGESTISIANDYGVDPNTITNQLRNRGIPIRPAGAYLKKTPQETVDEIAALYGGGLSQDAIADRLGLSQAAVSRIMRNAGIKTREVVSRGHHGMWRGGRQKIGGYFQIIIDRDDPMFVMANSLGYVMEHRLVMARHLGRPLERTETVHHINGDRQDNRIENLQVRHGRHGKGVVLRCRCCGSTDIETCDLD
jgi:transposase